MVTCNIGKTGLTRNHIAGSIPESNFDLEMTVGTRGHSRPALRSLRSLRAVRSFRQPLAGRLAGQRVDLWHPVAPRVGKTKSRATNWRPGLAKSKRSHLTQSITWNQSKWCQQQLRYRNTEK